MTDVVTGLSADQVAAFAEGILLGSYRYSEKSGDGRAATDGQARTNGGQVRLLAGESGDQAGDESGVEAPESRADVPTAIERAATVAGAVALTRDLTNTPSLRKNPQWLADAAVSVAEDAGLEVTGADRAGTGRGRFRRHLRGRARVGAATSADRA